MRNRFLISATLVLSACGVTEDLGCKQQFVDLALELPSLAPAEVRAMTLRVCREDACSTGVTAQDPTEPACTLTGDLEAHCSLDRFNADDPVSISVSVRDPDLEAKRPLKSYSLTVEVPGRGVVRSVEGFPTPPLRNDWNCGRASLGDLP